jgi:hypothetical protein
LTIAGFEVEDFFHMTEQEVVNEARIYTYLDRKRYASTLYEMTGQNVRWDPRLNSNAAAPHVNGLAHTGGAVIATPTVAVGFATDAVAPQVQRITDPSTIIVHMIIVLAWRRLWTVHLFQDRLLLILVEPSLPHRLSRLGLLLMQ